jgi:acetolactate synthase small subunit
MEEERMKRTTLSLVLVFMAALPLSASQFVRMDFDEVARGAKFIVRAQVVDTTTQSFIFELTGSPDKIDSFIALMRELGLVEVGRTGIVGMMRGAEGA